MPSLSDSKPQIHDACFCIAARHAEVVGTKGQPLLKHVFVTFVSIAFAWFPKESVFRPSIQGLGYSPSKNLERHIRTRRATSTTLKVWCLSLILSLKFGTDLLSTWQETRQVMLKSQELGTYPYTVSWRATPAARGPVFFRFPQNPSGPKCYL